MILNLSRSLAALCLVGRAFSAFSDFGIPVSDATVNVRMFNVGNLTGLGELHTLITPDLPGHQDAFFTMYSFLIEHSASKKRYMFDLGMRKDPLNFAPTVAAFFSSGVFSSTVEKDIVDVLQENGIATDTIDAVIWSHDHFDHIGDMSRFPNSTGLVIGAETDMSTFPQNPNATLQTNDFAGHSITKIDFSHVNLTFGSIKAFDFFGDGSLYLMNTPGHVPGHLSALARVTPTSFVVLGGDVFHHAGEARPRPAFQAAFPCPAHILAEAQSPAGVSTDFFWSPKSRDGAFDLHSRASQLLDISDLPDSFTSDPVTAQVSLEKLATFDADEDFFVVVAHDMSIVNAVPFFPQSLNGWKAGGLKEATVWKFIEPTNPAFLFSPINSTQ